MMSGLRSHLAYTITWVSDKSGIASSFVFLIAFHPSTMATATKRKIRNRFLSLKSIILFIIGISPHSSIAQRRGRFRRSGQQKHRRLVVQRRRRFPESSDRRSLHRSLSFHSFASHRDHRQWRGCPPQTTHSWEGWHGRIDSHGP